MTKRSVGVVIGLAVCVAVGLALWKSRGDDRSAPATPAGGGVGAGAMARAGRGATGPATGIDVVVHGVDGAPAPGAVVRVGGADSDDVAPRVAGGDGRASFDVAPGRYRVTASAPDRAAGEGVVDVPAAGRATAVLRLGAPAPVLRGEVTDMSGGPIEGAVVRVARLHGGLRADTERALAAITDATGRFAAAVAPGRYQVGTRHPEYLRDDRPVEVGVGGAELSIRLAPGAVVEGIVIDRQRGAVGGAAVHWDRELVQRGPFGGGRIDTGAVIAGADGRFRITGLGAGRIALEASADDGRESARPVEVELGIAETASGVELAIAAPAQAAIVVGRVENPDGTPATASTVMIVGERSGRGISVDDRGGFRIAGLAPGGYRLIAAGPAVLNSDPVTVEVGAAPVAPVTLRLQAGAYIAGRVEPPEPADVEQDVGDASGFVTRDFSRLASGELRVRTEADGTFRIGPFPPGEVALIARAGDGRNGRAEVVVPAPGEVVIRLADRGAIAGRVVDASGKPVPGAAVSLRLGGATRTMVVNGLEVSADRAPTDASGGFRIAGRRAGTWELSVLDHRGARLPFARGKPDAPVRVTLAEGEAKAGVELVVEAPTGVIRGIVVATGGAPIADAWVTVAEATAWSGPRGMPPDDDDDDDDGDGPRTRQAIVVMSTGTAMAGEVPPVLTGPDGKFSIGGLRRGTYAVTAEGLRGTARGTRSGVVVERGPVDVRVEVVVLATIAGVVRSDGAPVTDFEIEAVGPHRKQREVHDDAGRFELRSLDPGRYALTATGDGGTGTATVDVAAGETARATIEVVRDGRVRGRLVDAAGAPLADQVVLVVPRQQPGEMSVTMTGPPPRTAADGAFSAPSPGGPRTLVIMGDRGPVVRRDVEVKAGEVLDLGTLRPDPPRAGRKPAG